MRHDLSLHGHAFRLRPIADADAPFVLELRGDPERARHLHPTSPSLADQLNWFACYYERAGDYYFVVERLETDAPEGLVAIFDVSPESADGEWGRWILRPGSLAAVESAWLTYRCAFEQLGLEQVYSRTAAHNRSVVSFHDSCGITRRRLLPGHVEICGTKVNAIEHTVDRQSWPQISSRLQRLSQLTAQILRRR